MKVLLANPATPKLWVPRMLPMLGILYVGAALRKWANVEPSFWDGNYHSELPEPTDILMVTANSGTYAEAEKLASQIDASLKVVGGPHPTSMPLQCLNPDSPFDVAVMREGEETAVEVVKRYVETHCLDSLKDVTGIAVRLDSTVKVNPLRDFLDIDTIPWPAYDLWPELGNISAVASEGSPAGSGCSILTSRGCPYTCNFCDLEVWGRHTRFRNAEDVLAEAEFLKARFGITHLRLQDDTVNLRKNRFAIICRGLRKLGFIWRAHTRTDHVSLDEFKMMKDCGCVEIAFGIESGSQKILNLMNKKTTVENHANAIAWATEAGLNVRAFLIIGFPGDTWDTIHETVEFIRCNRPHSVSLSTFVPLPGSAVWKNPEAFDVTIKSQDWDEYWQVGNEETDKGFPAEHPSMTRMELLRAREYMLREFAKMFGSRDRRAELDDV